MKIIKIKACNGSCKYFDFIPKDVMRKKISRFVCVHPFFAKKYNGCKIINRENSIHGKIPDWCPLEDYDENNKN